MARPIINFDQTRLYIPLSDVLDQKTRINEEIEAGTSSFQVISRNGFDQPGFAVLGEIGSETSEIVQIKAEIGEFDEVVYGDALYAETGAISELRRVLLEGACEFEHDNKEPIYLIKYDQAKIYQSGTLIGTVSLIPDYLTSFSATVSNTKTYQISYYNTITSTESPKGLAVNGYDRLLCSSQDMRKIYSDIQAAGVNLIDKMDIARDEIRRALLSQGNDFDDFDYLEQLAMPAAFLSCYYAYSELSKAKDDESAHRRDDCYQKFEKEFEIVLKTLES